MDYKEKIKDNGYMIGYIAKKIGISNVLMSYYLNGTRPMPEHIEKRLKEVLE